MPFDQKRINGPDTSFSYKQFIEQPKESEDQKTVSKLKRADGRKLDEHRRFALQLGTNSKAKGSCYIENGSTKVLCAVFELREMPRVSKYADKGTLHCDFRYAPFSRINRKSASETEEKLIISNVKAALESTVCLHEFPNYQVDIFILVLEDDGAVLSTSINAAGMAFIDASIPCYDLITSSTIAMLGDKLLIDPTAIEEETESVTVDHGSLTISSLSGMEQVAQIVFKGSVDQNILKEAKNKLIELNKESSNYLKKVLSSKIKREFLNKERET